MITKKTLAFFFFLVPDILEIITVWTYNRVKPDMEKSSFSLQIYLFFCNNNETRDVIYFSHTHRTDTVSSTSEWLLRLWQAQCSNYHNPLFSKWTREQKQDLNKGGCWSSAVLQGATKVWIEVYTSTKKKDRGSISMPERWRLNTWKQTFNQF